MDQPIRPIFDPRQMPARGTDGFVHHPDLDDRWDHPLLGEEYMDTLMLAEAGFAWDWCDMEHDVSDEEFEAMCSDCDCSDWAPPDRSADGWRLVAIYDTEDGPRAFYIRPIEGDEQAELVAKERAQLAELTSQRERRR